MAFTVSDLTDYIKENEKEIISSALFTGKSISMFYNQVGIKSSEDIETMETTAPFQLDSGCVYNSSGTTSFSRRNLVVKKIMISETLCPEDLEAKYLQRLVQPGGTHDKLPLEKEIVDRKIALIARQLEIAVWVGNTDFTWNTNLKQFDGVLKLIKAASSSTINATTTAAVTSANIVAIVQEMFTLIPANLLGQTGDTEPVLFMGWSEFRMYINALTTANMFHFDAGNAAKTGELIAPGTGIKMVAVHGLDLNGETNLPVTYRQNMILTYPKNLYFGTDMANEYEKYDVWFSKDDQNIKSMFRFKAGAQIAFPELIVVYKNT